MTLLRPSLARACVVVIVALAALVGGCNEPPSVRDVLVPGDGANPTGPYEVRAVVRSDDGVASAALRFADAVDSDDIDLAAVSTDDNGDVRFAGDVDGVPVGTVVEFAVVACDPFDACVIDPPNFPDDAWRFLVGRVPSVPAVARIAPDQGPASGGTVVDIVGDGFAPDVEVSFGGVAAAHVERLRDTLLRAVTPPHDEGVVDVVIANIDANGAGGAVTVSAGFTYTPAPRLFGVAPQSGPEAGGTSIAVVGEGFVPGDVIVVGGVPCRALNFIGATSLTCLTPPGVGVVDVEVVSVDGARAALPEAFRYVAAPRIDGVQPDRGNAEVDTEIVIIGSGLIGVVDVEVGGAACAIVSQSDAQLVCVVPPGEPGVKDVRAIGSDGQEGLLPGGFAHLGPPLVVVVDPAQGPLAGGITVRVLGAGLDATDVVSFGDALATVVDAFDDVELVVTLPRAALPAAPAPDSGFVDVDVSVTRTRVDDTRSDVLVAGFRYLWPPEVQSVAPASGPITGGTAVIVNGRFFTETTELTFDGVACVDVEFLSATQLRCTTPPGDAGLADVSAVDRAGFADDVDVEGTVAVGVFTYVPPPRIDTIAPNEGPTFGGDVVTIRGDFFLPGALVFIDGGPCSGVAVVDAQTLTCTTPPGERGRADVRVQNIDGQEDTAPNLYTYVGVAVVPDHGFPVGFTRVAVRGAGFSPGVLVFFDGVLADCAFVSAREASCQTPPQRNGQTGLVEVRFTNPDGTGDADEAFTYTSLRRRDNVVDVDARNANHVALADADADGDLDVFVAFGRVSDPDTSSVFLTTASAGALSFEELQLPGGAVVGNKIDVGRINDDAFPDLVIASSSQQETVLLRSTGPARWTPVDLPLNRDNSAFDAQLADVVGDDRDDLFILGIGCDPQTVDPGQVCDPTTAGTDALFEQTGQDGGSVLSRRDAFVPHEARQAHDHKFVVTDLDGDDDNDMVVVVNNTGFPSAQNRILRNRTSEGLGFVKEGVGVLSALRGDLYDITAADIDGDGDNDVLTSLCFNEGGTSSEIVLENVDGNLVVNETALPAERDDCSIGVVASDLDGDGDQDLLWAGATRPQGNIRLLVRMYVNRGDGTFVDASAHVPEFNRRAQGNSLACGDLDGDDDVDCALAVGGPYVDQTEPGELVILEQRARGQ